MSDQYPSGKPVRLFKLHPESYIPLGKEKKLKAQDHQMKGLAQKAIKFGPVSE